MHRVEDSAWQLLPGAALCRAMAACGSQQCCTHVGATGESHVLYSLSKCAESGPCQAISWLEEMRIYASSSCLDVRQQGKSRGLAGLELAYPLFQC